MEERRWKNTHDLLTQVAKHLSGRPEYRQVEYTVNIDPLGLEMNPVAYMRSHRDRKVKEELLEHIFNHHMLDKNFKFCYGKYKYALSVTKKSRKWIRII